MRHKHLHFGGFRQFSNIIDYTNGDMYKIILLIYHDDMTPNIDYNYALLIMHEAIHLLQNNSIHPTLIYELNNNTFHLVFRNMNSHDYVDFVNNRLDGIIHNAFNQLH